MAELKRKGAAPVTAPPTKKVRKTSATEPSIASTPATKEPATKISATNDVVAKSKSGRKRAADFLEDDAAAVAPQEEKPEPSKKSKKSTTTDVPGKSRKGQKNLLSADGSNGIVEHKDDANVEIATALDTSSTSLEAEGLRTADKELAEENASDDEDQGAALLAGFDSDSDDPAEDQGDMSRVQPIPQFKKTSKKLKQAKERGSDGPGTVYVGRIPHGFYEQQMRDYFSQFGDISRLRLSRNKRTGASKHFAFIEFASDEVAKIVADTMDNYLMFGHILKCKYAPSDNLHPDVWKGANKKFRKIPYEKLQRQQLEAPKTQEQWSKKNEKTNRKRQKQAEKMKAIGYEYVVPELKDPAEVVEQRKLQEDHGIPAAALTSEEQPDAIEAPPAPADEVALKKEKKVKKPKVTSKKSPLTEGNLDAQVKHDEKDTATPATVSSTTSKKSKKSSKAATSTMSSHGDYDNLSSIQVGSEAAPASVTDAVSNTNNDTIFTHDGVADAVLADRKSDRKKAKSSKSSDNKKAEAKVAELAPDAVSSKKEKNKQLKGILKKGKKA